ncbi:MAG: ABC transporter permease [Planctomycetota bacterium]|jgi:ABC-type transport system involved in multi-copper enzyme maturation permease subunit
MPIEYDLVPFWEWLPLAFLYTLIVYAGLAALALVIAKVVSVVKHGPWQSRRRISRALGGAAIDMGALSFRRVWSLARLAVKESIRRRIIVVFGVFVLVILFAGWFMDQRSPNPGRRYLDFVLSWPTVLVLGMALLLSTLSLPRDIRTKTLHTVVTKPVRPSEIVLGRILGFTLVGTGFLAVMALVTAGFVVLGLAHGHDLTAANLRPAGRSASDTSARSGRTGMDEHGSHRHDVYIGEDGAAHVETERGHWHDLTVSESGPDARYDVGSARGMLVARVAIRGKLGFRDRDGLDSKKGISVGKEWEYRQFIEGDSQMVLFWTFDDVHEDDFPDGLPIEINQLNVFRSHKGIIERGVYGGLSVRNPKTGLSVEVEVFESEEFGVKQIDVPRRITTFSGKPMLVERKEKTADGIKVSPPKVEQDASLTQRREFDLFEDFVDDGEVEIWLRCLEPGQYFGAAQNDLYIRADDALFALNFVKGYFGIWLQMVLVIGVGVMFSTFLSGPVAMLATLGVLVCGFFVDFMIELSQHKVYGGGPMEAAVRLVKQENLVTKLDPGIWTIIVQMFDRVMEGGLWVVSIDRVMEGGLWVISTLLPPFARFGFADWVSYGFNVPASHVLQCALRAVTFLVPMFLAGYFLLKTREVAR